MNAPGIQLIVHPPERRRPKAVTVSCCCSCCCCCCLHTIGGLIGASMASRVQAPLGADDFVFGGGGTLAGGTASSQKAAISYFWISTVVLSVLFMLFGGVLGNIGELNVFVVLILLALMFPAIQLVAGVVAAGLVMITPSSKITDKGAAFGKLGVITGGMFGGAMLGVGVMIVLAWALGMWR